MKDDMLCSILAQILQDSVAWSFFDHIRISITNNISFVVTKWLSTSLTLLLADTNCSASSTSCLWMLTSDSETPVMSKTTMSTDLLQSLQIFTKFRFHTVGQNLRILSINNISLSVQEPWWNLVLCWILNDCDNSFEFFWSNFTGSVSTLDLSFHTQINPTSC